MKHYFEKMPLFGKELSEQKKADVDNIRNIFDVEETVDHELKKRKKLAFLLRRLMHEAR